MKEMAEMWWIGYSQCYQGYRGKQTRQLKSPRTVYLPVNDGSTSSNICFHGCFPARHVSHGNSACWLVVSLPKHRTLSQLARKVEPFPRLSNISIPHCSSIVHGGDIPLSS